MPRFFFHICDGETYRDEEGQNLPDREAARTTALSAARELIAEGVREGHVSLHERIEVADEAGTIVATVTFRDAIEFDS